MARITDGLYPEDGECRRWAITREADDVSFELRVSIKEPYIGTARISIFTNEVIGEEAKSVMLDAEHVEELIADLQEALSVVRGETWA